MRKVFLLLLGLLPMLLLAQNNSKSNQKNNNTQTLTDKSNMKKIEVKQTAGRTALGDFAPEFAHLNDDVLFGEVWNRNDKLSMHDRSMLTVTALVSMGITDNSLKYHLATAKQNGVTKTEIAELLTHIAFYVGWPKAWGAFNLAKEVWNGDTKATPMSKEAYQQTLMFPIGKTNDAYAKYFIGQSYIAPVSTEQVPIHNVTFEPGCRNNWHIHHATKGGGQMLICVGGEGWYQEWGKPARKLLPGDVVNIPAEVKHWHGAAADSWFSHLAIEVTGENTSNEWLEPVSDEEYKKLK
jgi:4-carboxymuconolactone decarboxylase